MRLRTKLLIGILATLLLQMAVTGTFTLTSFLFKANSSLETDLQGDWDRARAQVEELKHRLYTDLYQLSFFLQQDQADGASLGSLQQMIHYYISLTNADRIVLIDDPGQLIADERAGIRGAKVDLPLAFLLPRAFRFPRNQFVSVKTVGGAINLYLVTGTTIFRDYGGARHLYLVTDVDAGLDAAIQEKTGTQVAFYVGKAPAASPSTLTSFATDAASSLRTMRIGDTAYSVYSQPLSADVQDKIYLVAFRSLLAQRLYIRSVLLSYLTAFLITLAASLFIATGVTSLAISPFSRLSQWLHLYRDTGEVGSLDIRSRDEVGFLAGTFHGMVASLIEEKRVIGEQLEQIRLLNAYNERIMNSIPAGIVVTDPQGAIEFCNSRFADLVGGGVASLRGLRLKTVMARSFSLGGEPAGEALALDRDTLIEGLTLVRPEEWPLHFTAKISPLELAGDRRGALIVLEDVTAAERFWSRMTIADKVTSLGILSAGMAHEINNPLGSILSHVEYLKAVEKESDKLESITWIERETNRISAIIKRIRAYSAPSSRKDSHADLNLVARETVDVLRFTLEKRRLALTLDLAEGLPAVVCPSDELKQVVLNILLNACEASADGGDIGIRTARNPDGRAVLAITDNGAGIDPADMKNIFDPFFTTKMASQGNGLGLSICYAIVKRKGGDIRVSSTPGKGTEVEVLLRVHERSDR